MITLAVSQQQLTVPLKKTNLHEHSFVEKSLMNQVGAKVKKEKRTN